MREGRQAGRPFPDPVSVSPGARQFVEFACALLSICCMVFLGFADDVLNLKWRHKLIFPTIATLPVLFTYAMNGGVTTVAVPLPLRFVFSSTIDIGFLYYAYMGMLAVFCTNAVNILAGINGVEVGQSLVIAIATVLLNLSQIFFFVGTFEARCLPLAAIVCGGSGRWWPVVFAAACSAMPSLHPGSLFARLWLPVGRTVARMVAAAAVAGPTSSPLLLGGMIQADGDGAGGHELSIVILLPFIAVSSALYHYNAYPSEVFVGDTFCYFSGGC